MRRLVVEVALEALEAAVPNLDAPIALMAGWRDPRGSTTEERMIVSSIDLRDVRDWERLADLLSSEVLVSARFTPELPEVRPTLLEQHLAGSRTSSRGGIVLRGPSIPDRRATPRVGRNEACPCGSATKFKKCCGE